MKTITKILLILTLGFSAVGADSDICNYHLNSFTKYQDKARYTTSSIMQNTYMDIMMNSLIDAKHSCGEHNMEAILHNIEVIVKYREDTK